jgi:hypothetical protein
MPSDHEEFLRLQPLLDAINADVSEISQGGTDTSHAQRLMQESLDVLEKQFVPLLANLRTDRRDGFLDAFTAVGYAIGDLCTLAAFMQTQLTGAGMPFSIENLLP